MPRPLAAVLLLGLLALVPGAYGHAAKKTICTITVNSADEKDTFRARLPKGDYEFVELVDKGRPDWLRGACRRNVQCDALIVSGHFNAGDTFYSDRLDRNEYLEIDELERAACSASCPNLFARLKEVYLFGCESLNPDATRYASAYGESGRERMRRIFAGVPVIYGFSSSAPVGPTAAMLLNRYFDGGGRGALGTGVPDSRLLRAFSRNSMVHVAGTRPGEALSAERATICRFFDEREDAAARLAFVHGLLRGEAGEAGRYFGRIEKALAADEGARSSPEYLQALARISADEQARSRFLALARRASQPALRARMLAVAARLAWLSPQQEREEHVALINDMVGRGSVGFAEVDLACSLNRDGRLDGDLGRIATAGARGARVGHAAVLACLGSADAHAQVVRALASRDEGDVQVVRAYLRHRSVDNGELRAVVRDLARAPGPASVRALESLARLHISDREILEDLSRAFAETRSVQVQRAIAEVFIRSDPQALPRRKLAATLREHRLSAPGSDLVDALLARLQ